MDRPRMLLEFNPATCRTEVKVKCTYCEEVNKFEIPDEDLLNFKMWTEGKNILIQDAIPHVSPENRELLISGICPKCWDATFK